MDAGKRSRSFSFAFQTPFERERSPLHSRPAGLAAAKQVNPNPLAAAKGGMLGSERRLHIGLEQSVPFKPPSVRAHGSFTSGRVLPFSRWSSVLRASLKVKRNPFHPFSSPSQLFPIPFRKRPPGFGHGFTHTKNNRHDPYGVATRSELECVCLVARADPLLSLWRSPLTGRRARSVECKAFDSALLTTPLTRG